MLQAKEVERELTSRGVHNIKRSEITQTHTSSLRTGPQQVDHVQMMSDVVQDLELSHQGFVFTGCSSLWWTEVGKWVVRQVVGESQQSCTFEHLHCHRPAAWAVIYPKRCRLYDFTEGSLAKRFAWHGETQSGVTMTKVQQRNKLLFHNWATLLTDKQCGCGMAIREGLHLNPDPPVMMSAH